MTSISSFRVIGNFALCKDVGGIEPSRFWVDSSNTDMTTDNLRFYEIVKLPDNKQTFDFNGFLLSVGDVVISIATGTDVRFEDDPQQYKLFDLEYITAKKEI